MSNYIRQEEINSKTGYRYTAEESSANRRANGLRKDKR